MRRFVLMVLAGLAIAAAVPQSGSASPLMPAAGLAAAVDDIAVTQDVRYRRWHHHPHWRHYGWRHHRHWRHYGWRRHHWRHYGWRHHRWHHRRHWARYY